MGTRLRMITAILMGGVNKYALPYEHTHGSTNIPSRSFGFAFWEQSESLKLDERNSGKYG